MPSIDMNGGVPTTRWFRDPVMTIGKDAHGYRLLALLGSAGAQSTGGLWLQISSKSLRLDNGSSSDSNNALMTAKYPATIGLGYSKAVIPATPGVLQSFVEMFKGLTGFIAPTKLICDKSGKVLPEYVGLTVVGTVSLEEMMDLPATASVRAPSTGRRAAAPVAPVELTEEQLEAKLAEKKAARAAEAKAQAEKDDAELKRLIAEKAKREKADADVNGTETKVTGTTKKDFVGKETKAPIA